MVLAPEPEIKPLVNDQILPWSLAPPIIVAESKSWERRDVPGGPWSLAVNCPYGVF